jgi:hypothetical protein
MAIRLFRLSIPICKNTTLFLTPKHSTLTLRPNSVPLIGKPTNTYKLIKNILSWVDLTVTIRSVMAKVGSLILFLTVNIIF